MARESYDVITSGNYADIAHGEIEREVGMASLRESLEELRGFW